MAYLFSKYIWLCYQKCSRKYPPTFGSYKKSQNFTYFSYRYYGLNQARICQFGPLEMRLLYKHRSPWSHYCASPSPVDWISEQKKKKKESWVWSPVVLFFFPIFGLNTLFCLCWSINQLTIGCWLVRIPTQKSTQKIKTQNRKNSKRRLNCEASKTALKLVLLGFLTKQNLRREREREYSNLGLFTERERERESWAVFVQEKGQPFLALQRLR